MPIVKQVLRPERLREVPEQFSWVCSYVIGPALGRRRLTFSDHVVAVCIIDDARCFSAAVANWAPASRQVEANEAGQKSMHQRKRGLRFSLNANTPSVKLGPSKSTDCRRLSYSSCSVSVLIAE